MKTVMTLLKKYSGEIILSALIIGFIALVIFAIIYAQNHSAYYAF